MRSPARAPGGPSLEGDKAPKIIARLPFVERADHPASLPVFAIVPPGRRRDRERSRGLQRQGVGLERRRRARALPARRRDRGAGRRLRRRGAAGLGAAGRKPCDITSALVKAGASVRSTALVGSHATRYTVAGGRGRRRANSCWAHAEACWNDRPSRPQPRPGVLDIEAYVPGKSTAPGVAKVYKLSSNETPLGAEPEGDRGLSRGRPRSGGLSGRRGDRVCARRSARRTASIPARIVCGAGSDDLLNLLARAYLADGDEAIYTDARLPGLSDRDARRRREAGGRGGEELHRRRRRDPAAR